MVECVFQGMLDVPGSVVEDKEVSVTRNKHFVEEVSYQRRMLDQPVLYIHRTLFPNIEHLQPSSIRTQNSKLFIQYPPINEYKLGPNILELFKQFQLARTYQ